MRANQLAPATAVLIAAFGLSLPTQSGAQAFNDIESEPHNYYKRNLNDPFTLLLEKRDRGEEDLGSELGKGGIAVLLEKLNIPVESQVLVFSKTSLQRAEVKPENPRAIYFNEDAYLGWMPGGRVEITSMDPEAGGVFFFEKERSEPGPPEFIKPNSCIQCHAGDPTNFLPGLLGRSTRTDETGRSRGQVQSFVVVEHSVPVIDRWGGWYVTGQHGDMRHMGNSLTVTVAGVKMVDRDSGANLDKLDDFFDTSIHLRPDSDIVAMLVLDHQIGAHNALMEAQYRMRNELHKTDGKLEGWTLRTAKQETDRVLNYFLFKDEAEIAESGVSGKGDFEKAFRANRRMATDGSSLKDFHLKGRIFKHRCSYMIHSKAFRALPEVFRKHVLQKLHTILTAEKPVKGYEYLGDDERAQIFKILSETLEGGFPID